MKKIFAAVGCVIAWYLIGLVLTLGRPIQLLVVVPILFIVIFGISFSVKKNTKESLQITAVTLGIPLGVYLLFGVIFLLTK